ncbi:MAG TPA: succinyl-diaminopimelate desuccinylase [Woeseiaceae bacterium]|nr:succinyl-diaminopimelate desuccinylase [Woeseiaceae bacterium]
MSAADAALANLADKDPLIHLLCDLLRRPSVTPDDAGCQALLASRLAACGFTCESLSFGDVTNLWARRGNASPLFCFAGHTDVVPPGEACAWQSDPFAPSLRDGLLYARGAADMKSSLAAMIVAVERFVHEQPDHSGSIAFLITSDEEGEARDGTLKVMETLRGRGEEIDWCIVGEPSSQSAIGDTVRIGRRGSLSGELVVRGTQGHVAYPEFADNPIRRFAPALAELYATRWDEGNDYFPPTGFEFVSIDSGAGAPNVTPGELRGHFNFRYSTEWHHESLQRKLEAILRSHELQFEVRWHLSGEPFFTRPGKLTDAVSQAVSDATGSRPELSTGGGTSDGRFIAPSGAGVVELGPINASIHKVDEHVQVADLPKLCDIYRRILELLLR